MQVVSKVEQLNQVSKVEQQQIESSMQKNNLMKQTPVISEQQKVQKIFCHFCPERTELINKEFFYTFPNGQTVMFCNSQERDMWLKLHNIQP